MKCKNYLPLLFLILLSNFYSPVSGADFKKMIPITDRIICLYFEDGYIVHPTLGQIPWIDGDAFFSLIDSAKASDKITYSIWSAEDADYQTPANPVRLGRKTKGIDFLDKETPGKKYNYKIPGHWIYLKFEKPFKAGKQYTLRFPGLANNQDSLQFTYNETENVSEAIHVNQVGYSTNASLKFGYVYHWMGEMGSLTIESPSAAFHLLSVPENKIVYSGKLNLSRELIDPQPVTPFYKNDFCMSSVYRCDFSDFNMPGNYKLVVDGVGSSYPFEIGVTAYKEAYTTVMSGLFHHRSGVDRTSEYSKWIKPVEHKPGVNNFVIRYSTVRHMDGGNNFSGLANSATGEIFPSHKGAWMPENNDDWGWGGYFDAGDYDRQSGHLAAAEYLLFAYEFCPQNFMDGDLNIPESGNGIPDIIDEAKWGIDCFRRLQGPTGGICGGMEENEHPLPGENSITDSRPWYVYGEEPLASFRLASVAIQLAFTMEMAGNVSESDSLFRQAKRVYNWAKSKRDASKANNNWQRAAIWLFKYSGDSQYLNDFLKLYNSGVRDNFALFVYATLKGVTKDQTILNSIKLNIISQADNLILQGKIHPASLIPAAKSGWNTLNFLSNVHKLFFAWQISNNPVYLDYVYTTCDYNLGANPENLVFVTGLGEKHINDVFNMDSWYDGIDESIPGIVPYGLTTEFVSDDKTAVWRPYQTYTSCYPDYTKWPSGELWFENRYLINCNEYTIGETLGPTAGAYSIVAGDQWAGITDRQVKGLSLNLNEIKIKPGDVRKINASVTPYYAANRHIEWISLDTSICSVDSLGFISGNKYGITKVIAKSVEGNFTDSCLIIVEQGIISGNDLEAIENKINVYPIPANEALNIDFINYSCEKDFSYCLISSSGQTVLNKRISVSSFKHLFSISINNNSIKKGVYFLYIWDNDKLCLTRKIVIN